MDNQKLIFRELSKVCKGLAKVTEDEKLKKSFLQKAKVLRGFSENKHITHYPSKNKNRITYLCNQAIISNPNKITAMKGRVTCQNCKKILGIKK